MNFKSYRFSNVNSECNYTFLQLISKKLHENSNPSVASQFIASQWKKTEKPQNQLYQFRLKISQQVSSELNQMTTPIKSTYLFQLQDDFILLKIIEEAKEILFMWVISITVYCMRN